MTPEERRAILQRVADGELTPEEADELLRGRDKATPATGVDRIRISVGVGGIDVVGDPSVQGAEVDGPHRAEMDGDTLEISGEWDPDADEDDRAYGFRFGRRAKVIIGAYSSGDERKIARLRVRMNPELPLDCELDAGPVKVSGVHGPIRIRLAAGPVSIDDFAGPLDVSVNAGAVRANGRLVEGESRIRSDAGAVRVRLDPTSSVHIIAHAALGKVLVGEGNGRKKGGFGSDRREATIGDGEATLRVETAMGSVHVT